MVDCRLPWLGVVILRVLPLRSPPPSPTGPAAVTAARAHVRGVDLGCRRRIPALQQRNRVEMFKQKNALHERLLAETRSDLEEFQASNTRMRAAGQINKDDVKVDEYNRPTKARGSAAGTGKNKVAVAKAKSEGSYDGVEAWNRWQDRGWRTWTSNCRWQE